MKNSDSLIKTLYQLDYSDLNAIDDLIGSIAAHIAIHGPDPKLELALHVTKARKEDELNNGFDKVCAAAQIVVDMLKDQEDWDINEFDMFCTVLGRIESYELTIAMMEKCLDMLERNFKNLPHYEHRKGLIYGEMTWRLVRAKYFDNVNPQELKKLFDTCVKSAIKIWEDLGRIELRTAVLVREAIFNQDATEILECVRAMEITRDKYWIKSSKDEVVEYVRFLGKNVTADLHNFMFGWQVKKQRIALGIKTIDFADMIGSSQTVVNEMERGGKGVGTERLYAIADALQVHNMSYFFGQPLISSSAVANDADIYQVVQLMTDMPVRDRKLGLTLIKGLSDHGKE